MHLILWTMQRKKIGEILKLNFVSKQRIFMFKHSRTFEFLELEPGIMLIRHELKRFRKFEIRGDRLNFREPD